MCVMERKEENIFYYMYFHATLDAPLAAHLAPTVYYTP